ncbi:MAG: hypothetical protein P8R54_09750 [Myxococcota bacterium]|nr:hypothetical protein [Myxococcota bacterium]
MTYGTRAEAARLVWGATTGRLLSEQGCSPTLIWLTALVREAIPAGPLVGALTGFVLRNRDSLMQMVDDAFLNAPPWGSAYDAFPPRVGVLHRAMSLAEAEDAMRGEDEEHVVIIDGATGQQIARFGPAMTRAQGHEPRGLTVIDRRLYPLGQRSGQWILSHNHPACGPLSTPDLSLAAAMNLQTMRAVCADGWVWWIDRPAQGWPDYHTVHELASEAYHEAYLSTMHASALYCDLTATNPQEHSDAWKRDFNQTFLTTFNRQGRGLGLRVQGARPDGSDPR